LPQSQPFRELFERMEGDLKVLGEDGVAVGSGEGC